MTATAEALAHRIAVARGDRPADVVLQGGSVLSVLGELAPADVAIAGEHVAALGHGYEVSSVSRSPAGSCYRASSTRTCTWSPPS